MTLAMSGLGSKGSGIFLALAGGLAILGALIFIFLGRQLPFGGRWPILAVIAVGGMALAALAILLNRR